MEEIDLHGLNHEQVWDKVENFILLNSDKLPVRIITGLSEKMQDLVKEVLDYYEFGYEVPIYNPGQITVLEDKELIWHQKSKK